MENLEALNKATASVLNLIWIARFRQCENKQLNIGAYIRVITEIFYVPSLKLTFGVFTFVRSFFC